MFCMQESESEGVWLYFHEFGIFKLLCMWMQVGEAMWGSESLSHYGVGGVERVEGFCR